MFDIIYIAGYESCTYFYQAMIYASFLKKFGLCIDYEVKSFETRDDFFSWLESDFPMKNNTHKTSPIIWTSQNKFIGGCSDLKEFLKDIDDEGLQAYI